MDVRKITRNPGWWRLFKVLAGLWYLGFAAGGCFLFFDEVLPEISRPVETTNICYSAPNGSGDFVLGCVPAGASDNGFADLIPMRKYTVTDDAGRQLVIGGIDHPTEAELEAVFLSHFGRSPWYLEHDFLAALAFVIVFPWLVYLVFFLTRYVIEGFFPQRNTL